MLQRSALKPPMSQSEDAPTNAGEPAQVTSWIQHFLILMVLISAIACAFVWQANAIADTQYETLTLRREAVSLEQENARLMVRLAALNSPANVEREAARMGLSTAKAPAIHVYPVFARMQHNAPGMTSTRVQDQLVSLVHRAARRSGLPALARDAAP